MRIEQAPANHGVLQTTIQTCLQLAREGLRILDHAKVPNRTRPKPQEGPWNSILVERCRRQFPFGGQLHHPTGTIYPVNFGARLKSIYTVRQVMWQPKIIAVVKSYIVACSKI